MSILLCCEEDRCLDEEPYAYAVTSKMCLPNSPVPCDVDPNGWKDRDEI